MQHRLSSSSASKKPKENPKLAQYKVESVIGEGTYGKVKLCTHIATNEKVAIKFVEKNRLIRANDELRMKNEMEIITSLNHPNILKAFEIFEDETYYYIVMERPSNGDLFNYIAKKGRLPLNEACYIFYQIVNGIDYLHKNHVVHRDMKPENIMLTEDMIVKVGDFGLSRRYKNDRVKLLTICGSPAYSSPEMLRGNKYLPKPVDIWGLGIMLYVMICGQLPFDDNSEEILYRKIVKCEYSFPYFVCNQVKDLIRRIFVANPNERMTMEELKDDTIYNIGRANFYKDYKIYDDNGEIIPIVKEYIDQKTKKSLQTECSMEINKNTENTTVYKIFHYKYLHRTRWKDFHIPTSGAKIITMKKNDDLDEEDEDEDKFAKTRNLKSEKKKKATEDDQLLAIPYHENIGSCYAMTSTIPKTKNEDKNLVSGISKLGVMHSFDTRANLKSTTQREKQSNDTTYYWNSPYKKRSISTKEYNNTLNGTTMNNMKTYSKDDYEKDIKYLTKIKYLQNGKRYKG